MSAPTVTPSEIDPAPTPNFRDMAVTWTGIAKTWLDLWRRHGRETYRRDAMICARMANHCAMKASIEDGGAR